MTSCPDRKSGFLPDTDRGRRLDRGARVCRPAALMASSCALRDTYKPIKAECRLFQRVGEVKSRVSPTPNCAH